MIYTQTGDNGTTALAGGERVAKFHPRVEAYGDMDELGAHIALLAALQLPQNQQLTIKKIQSLLMQCAAVTAGSSNADHYIEKQDIVWLEGEIDALQNHLPALSQFVLQGGGTAASECHIARCVCRRAERHFAAIASDSDSDRAILRWLNRLSDYLFVLARTLCLFCGEKEEFWNVKKG
ncbi:cobalamin adenosyltransferase [Bacteroidia bacterium]|nr:cobalamin adenosyltransferase [Bacteroidia bacterium]